MKLMETRVKWKEHRGIKFLLCDFSELRWKEDLVELTQIALDILENADEQIYIIIDLTNTYLPLSYFKWILIHAKNSDKFIKKQAITGVRGKKKIMIENFVERLSNKTRTMVDQKACVDWFVQA